MNKYENMKVEAMEKIIEVLEGGFNGHYYYDLHNECFNTDYYIIGTYEAKKALEEFGTFNAIEKVMEYEKDNFGEVSTEVYNPEKLVNMLFYIIGEEVLYSLTNDIEVFQENWDNIADDETNAAILNELKNKEVL